VTGQSALALRVFLAGGVATCDPCYQRCYQTEQISANRAELIWLEQALVAQARLHLFS